MAMFGAEMSPSASPDKEKGRKIGIKPGGRGFGGLLKRLGGGLYKRGRKFAQKRYGGGKAEQS